MIRVVEVSNRADSNWGRLVASVLAGQAPQAVEVTVLWASELVTNAVLHVDSTATRSAIEVAVTSSDEIVRVEVTDDDPGMSPARSMGPLSGEFRQQHGTTLSPVMGPSRSIHLRRRR